MQSNKLGATTRKGMRRLCIQLSPRCDLKSIPGFSSTPTMVQPPCTQITGLQPFNPFLAGAQMWPQTPADHYLSRCSKDTATPKYTTLKFSLLFLPGITGEASTAEGTGKETAQSERCLPFSRLTSSRSYHNTHTLLSRRNCILCNTPSSFSNRSPPWCSVTCTPAPPHFPGGTQLGIPCQPNIRSAHRAFRINNQTGFISPD